MTARINQWIANVRQFQTAPIQGQSRAYDTAREIFERPTQVTLNRKLQGENRTIRLQPQTVRLEVIENPRSDTEKHGPNESITRQYVILIAFKSCQGYPDTDIQRADWFWYAGQQWTVLDLIPNLYGRLLVQCEIAPT